MTGTDRDKKIKGWRVRRQLKRRRKVLGEGEPEEEEEGEEEEKRCWERE